MTNTRTPPRTTEVPGTTPPARKPRRLAYAIASHLIRAALLRGLVALLTVVPANLDTWNDPNASVLPGGRTMPGWGNYLLAFGAILAFGALIARWFATSRSARDARGFRVIALVAAVGMTAWVAVLFVSQVISMRPQEGLVSVGIGLYGDAIFGVLALATAANLVWDARTRWRPLP